MIEQYCSRDPQALLLQLGTGSIESCFQRCRVCYQPGDEQRAIS